MIDLSQLAPPGSPEELLVRRLDLARLPRHVAVIMDGNGRWADARGLPRVAGHREGAKAVQRTVEAVSGIRLHKQNFRRLVEKEYREVVLTGVDLTAWGLDLPGAPRLGSLVRSILRHVPELPRLRISSLDPVEVDCDLLRAIAEEERLMPHLHLSLQHGDDLILKRMKRRHLRADAVRLVERLRARRPDIAIGADLIAGFPTETDDMHENSLRLVDECDIVLGHVFPFSPKKGTPAARMPQVPPPVVKARAKRLREACAERRAAWLRSLIGTRQRVLIEKDGFGHAENFAPVQMPPLHGEILEVEITGISGSTLVGVPA